MKFIEPDPRENKQYWIEVTFLRKAVLSCMRAGLSLMAVWQGDGLRNLPRTGPVILAINHLTDYDVLFMQFALPRPIYYMGREELFAGPLKDGMMRRMGAFPVTRGAHDEWAMRHASLVLGQGQVLCVFPEGQSTPGQGLRPARTAAARLAIETGAPILPAAINGSQNLLKRFPHRAAVRLRFGALISPQPDESPAALTDRVMFNLAALLPAALRGVYRQRPPGF